MNLYKTKATWLKHLDPNHKEALEDMTPSYDYSDLMSASEVMDAIINWEGGIASGYGVRSLVEEVYGINLNAEGIKW